MKKFILALILSLLSVPAYAQLGTVPYTFTDGTDILASEVNSNFTSAYANALNRTGGTMTGTLTAQQITPVSTGTYDLGTSLVKFRDGWFSRNLDVAGNFNLVGTLSDSDSAVTIGDTLQLTSTTTPQVQFRYDGSNYWETSISSAGAITLNAVGSSAGFTFSDALTINGAFVTASTTSPQATVRYDGSNYLSLGVGAAGGVTFDATGSGAAFTFSDAATFSAGVTVTSSTTTLQNANPLLKWVETGATADEGRWRMITDSDAFSFQALSDNESTITNIFTVGRSGATPDGVTFYHPVSLVTSGVSRWTLGQNILPAVDAVGDLGSTSARIGSLYLNDTFWLYEDSTEYFRIQSVGGQMTLYHLVGSAVTSQIISNSTGLTFQTTPSGTGSFYFSGNGSATIQFGSLPLYVNEHASWTPSPSSSNQLIAYVTGDKLVFAWNDGGTVRYKYLDLSGTGVTWVHTTTAP